MKHRITLFETSIWNEKTTNNTSDLLSVYNRSWRRPNITVSLGGLSIYRFNRKLFFGLLVIQDADRSTVQRVRGMSSRRCRRLRQIHVETSTFINSRLDYCNTVPYGVGAVHLRKKTTVCSSYGSSHEDENTSQSRQNFETIASAACIIGEFVSNSARRCIRMS